LKGKKPDKAVQAGNNIEVTLGQDKKKVTNVTYNLYGDSAIKAGLERLTNPLRQAAIDRIAVKQDGKEQTAIEKSDAGYFEAGMFELEANDATLEGQRDAVLIVSKLSFTEKSTWTFLERGATVVAKIDDAEFWDNVHQHKVTFGEGDRLRVRMFWTTVRKRNGLTAKNTIIKVYEVIVGQKQMRLDSRN
jgi:cystathionine beta-lyase/cystathionine gamma-synthase